MEFFKNQLKKRFTIDFLRSLFDQTIVSFLSDSILAYISKKCASLIFSWDVALYTDFSFETIFFLASKISSSCHRNWAVQR